MADHLLFSYGTLQKPEVQIANFGRELKGRQDELPGYRRGMAPILDRTIAAAAGESYFANLEPSSDPEDKVAGTVFEITGQELAVADRYEAEALYRRIRVTLRSGAQAWVYLRT